MLHAMKRPSPWLYVLALCLPMVGCGVTLASMFGGLDDIEAKVNGLARVPLPGEGAVDLPAGELDLFFETPNAAEGLSVESAAWSSHPRPPVSCRLADAAGKTVAVERSASMTRYAVPGKRGLSFASAEVVTPGRYQLSCTGPDATVAVGSLGTGGRATPMLTGMVAGLILAVVTFVLRRRRV
jgi:hypothetical protein